MSGFASVGFGFQGTFLQRPRQQQGVLKSAPLRVSGNVGLSIERSWTAGCHPVHFQGKPPGWDKISQVPDVEWPLFTNAEPSSVRSIGRQLQQIVEAEARRKGLESLWRLTPGAVQKIQRLQQSPAVQPKHCQVMDFMVNRHLFTLADRARRNSLGATAQEDFEGLCRLDPQRLNEAQRAQVKLFMSGFIQQRYKLGTAKSHNLDASDYQALRQATKPYNLSHMIDAIEAYVPYTNINGVQCVLLPERVGPPLENLQVATYNLEHFAIKKYSENALNHYDFEALPQAEREGQREKLLERALEVVMESLKKVFGLGRTIRTTDSSVPEPDVIAFQEVQSFEQLRDFLKINGLAQRYPNILYFPAVMGNDGLAVVASNRVRVHSPNRVRAGGAPRPSGEVSLDLGGGKEVVLFDVHLKADKYKYNRLHEEKDDVRLREVKALGRRMAELKETWPDVKCMVIGDFNTEHPGFLQKMSRLMKLKDVPQRGNPATHENGYLDRVFLDQGLSCEALDVIGSHENSPSDHLMLRAKIKVA